MAYTTLNKMVTVFINNIYSISTNVTKMKVDEISYRILANAFK